MEKTLNLTQLKTTRQTADILQVDIETVRRYIRTKQLKAVKFGKVYRIEDRKIQDLIDNKST